MENIELRKESSTFSTMKAIVFHSIVFSIGFFVLRKSFMDNMSTTKLLLKKPYISRDELAQGKHLISGNFNGKNLFSKEEIYDLWFVPYIKNKNILNESNEFVSPFNEKSFIWYYDLLETLFSALSYKKIPFLLYGGSVIGSLRHQGQIPWDDDADIIIPGEYRYLTSRVLRSIPDHVVASYKSFLKFYHLKNRQPVRDLSLSRCAWPMVDVVFYDNWNTTHVLHKGANDHFYSLKDFFPARYRYFWNWKLPVAQNCEKIILRKYQTELDICEDTFWNHKNQSVLHDKPRQINCSELHSAYPFLKKYKKKTTCLEKLIKNNKVLRITKCI